MNKEGFKEFLATGIAPKMAGVAVVVETADPIADLLSKIAAARLLAKDLHYRAYGRTFYGTHLLADVLSGIDKSSDDLFEVFYLGQCGSIPPRMSSIHRVGADIADLAMKKVGVGPTCEDAIVGALLLVFSELVASVETAKAGHLRSGVDAVLDEISKKALIAKGLLTRTTENEKVYEE